MKKKTELPLQIKPIRTYQLASGFIDGLDSLGDVRFEELIPIPKASGTYANLGADDNEAKAIGASYVYYVGYRPVFRENSANPYAFDICFHTNTKGVVPILRIGSMDSLDAELVDEINDLKLKANQAIAQKLTAADVNDVLVRYQWYASLLNHLDISLSPRDQKKSVAAVIDYASDQAGANVGVGKLGLWADDSSVAVKIMDHLGFIFNAPRKMAPQYPLDLNAYLATLLKDGPKWKVVVSHDLESYLTGSTAEIMPEANGAISYFRPVFAKTAYEAGELFRKMIGAPGGGQTAIETDEDLEDNKDVLIVNDTPPTRTTEPVGRLPGASNPFETMPADPMGMLEQQKLEIIKSEGFDIINENGKKLLIRKIAIVDNLDEALDIIEEESILLSEDPSFGPHHNMPPSTYRPTSPPTTYGNRQATLRDKYHTPRYETPNKHAKVTPLEEEEIPRIVVERNVNNSGFHASIGDEIILDEPTLEDIKVQLTNARQQDPELGELEVLYRTTAGNLEPMSLDDKLSNRLTEGRKPRPNTRRWGTSF